MLPAQGLLAKKAYLLIPLLLLLIIFLLAFNYLYLPWADKCIFENVLVCLQGKKFEKYNWQGNLAAQAYNLKNPVKIKAPLDGQFLFSPKTNINYKGEHLGVAITLDFKSEKMGVIEMVVAGKAKLLKGNIADWQEVKKGEIVAEIYPDGIQFLDNFSLIKASVHK